LVVRFDIVGAEWEEVEFPLRTEIILPVSIGTGRTAGFGFGWWDGFGFG
jgi:hypothetical protein